MFSGAYLNKFSYSVMTSDRIDQSMWSTRLCPSSPEVGNRVVVRNVQFKKTVDGPSPQKKQIALVSYTFIPHNYLEGVETNTVTSNLRIWPRNFLFYAKLVLLPCVILKAVVIQLYPLFCFTQCLPNLKCRYIQRKVSPAIRPVTSRSTNIV